MSRTVDIQGQRSWPTSIADPIVGKPETWRQSIHRRRQANPQTPSVSDVALLYPEAVVASSDAFAWQHVRVLQLRHSLDEMVVPPSDNHCIVLNLCAPLYLITGPGTGDLEGSVRTGEVA